MQKNNPFPVSLHLYERKNKPALEIRRLTQNPNAIKIIIQAALENKPIIVYPIFRCRPIAIARLQQVGVIKFNSKKNNYEYMI